jgi:predicted molibdopterin-dependent oxidoreductase YjgC
MSETTGPIKFTLDGREVEAPAGETIFRTARRYGIELPNLCYSPSPGYRPDGNCRVCMVEIEGERVLAASCIRTPTAGMKVNTQTDRAATARRMVAELLLADQQPHKQRTAIVRDMLCLIDKLPQRYAVYAAEDNNRSSGCAKDELRCLAGQQGLLRCHNDIARVSNPKSSQEFRFFLPGIELRH